MWSIQLSKLNFDAQEVKAVSNVVESGWLSMGEGVKKFETNFGKFLDNSVYCTAVSSGTAALHMALLALDIGIGDEVIIPSLTFVADINVVSLVGATPVLADVTSVQDWNMCVETIENQITNKTKAVIVVHYAGYPCKDINEIGQLCKKHNLHLIEDAAHAPGASVEGKKCGTFGDIGCFSFYSNKNLSIGEGGMTSTSNPDLQKKLGYLRSHGMTTLALDRHKGRSISYDVVKPGLNYRLDEMRAAIGLVQLEKLSNGNLRRGCLTEQYRSILSNTSVIIPFKDQPKKSTSAYHILPVLLPEGTDRISVINKMKEKGIQSSIHYPPFWSFKAYKGLFTPYYFPITEEISKRQLTLPLFPTMTNKEVIQVTTALTEALQ